MTHVFDRAAEHGFRSLRDVSRYADVAMLFGRDFDLDEQLGWARGILEASDLDSEARLDFLCREALRRAKES